MAATPFAIDVDAVGLGSVIVDGRDVSDEVAGLELTAGVGHVTRLVLHAHRPGRLSGEGIVEVAADTITADTIRQLDPAMVSRLVAERTEWGVDDAWSYLQVIADLVELGHG